MSTLEGFENLNYRKYSPNEIISLSEDGRGVLAMLVREDDVLVAISDEYCGVPVKLINTEFRKHNDELILTVEIYEDVDEVDIREFEIKIVAFYQ